jgi:hypothetical protein
MKPVKNTEPFCNWKVGDRLCYKASQESFVIKSILPCNFVICGPVTQERCNKKLMMDTSGKVWHSIIDDFELIKN